MNRTRFCGVLIGVIVSLGWVSAEAAPAPPRLQPQVAKGSHFDAVGRVILHAGQPCTPQIMFDFRGKTVVWLAAPKRESAILTDAVRTRRRVRVSGVWKRGRNATCSFVEVTAVVPFKVLGLF